ncbi:hypothetical protein GCM10010170_034910 [Dactylosporangium salmoneum]|uniref:Uncharacterized protein n=2 Tax=Dactylosporangium salmoneum TaxID=53361 RepID=A0ABN3GAA0_9ACTN
MARYVINPGGGPVHIPDVTAFLTEARESHGEPYIDLGGGMIVRLADHIQEFREADEAARFESQDG